MESAVQDIARVSQLTYEYPGVRALDAVSFVVPRGSVTALVGPNGAGKTTLLRCMAGLDQPLDGAIEIAGIDVLENPRECHRHIGYLSDFFGVYASLKVWQCLAHAASAQGLSDEKIQAAVADTAARLNLTLKLQDIAGTLSRGQRQRLAIGQALIHKPELLILDEPASGLDPEARHDLAALFKQLRSDGMTLIVSSHILAELDEYSTHMLVMREGRVVESRALNSGRASAAQLHVVAEFASESATESLATQVRDAIAALPNVQLVSITANRASFLLEPHEHARVELLRALIGAGLPVASINIDRENLHESYLRTMERTS